MQVESIPHTTNESHPGGAEPLHARRGANSMHLPATSSIRPYRERTAAEQSRDLHEYLHSGGELILSMPPNLLTTGEYRARLAARPLTPPTPVTEQHEGLGETDITPIPQPSRSQRSTADRDHQQVRANMPPEALQHGVNHGTEGPARIAPGPFSGAETAEQPGLKRRDTLAKQLRSCRDGHR